MLIHLFWIQQGLFWFRFDTDHCWGHSYIKRTVLKEGHKAEFRSFKWIQVYKSKCTPMCAPRCTPLLLVHYLETFKILDNNRTSGSELWIHLLFLCYRFNMYFTLLNCYRYRLHQRIFEELIMFSYGDTSKAEVLTLKILQLPYINKISFMTVFISSNKYDFPGDLNSHSALPLGATSL